MDQETKSPRVVTHGGIALAWKPFTLMIASGEKEKKSAATVSTLMNCTQEHAAHSRH